MESKQQQEAWERVKLVVTGRPPVGQGGEANAVFLVVDYDPSFYSGALEFGSNLDTIEDDVRSLLVPSYLGQVDGIYLDNEWEHFLTLSAGPYGKPAGYEMSDDEWNRDAIDVGRKGIRLALADEYVNFENTLWSGKASADELLECALIAPGIDHEEVAKQLESRFSESTETASFWGLMGDRFGSRFLDACRERTLSLLSERGLLREEPTSGSKNDSSLSL